MCSSDLLMIQLHGTASSVCCAPHPQLHWMTPKTVLFYRLAWPSLSFRRRVQALSLFYSVLRTNPPLLSDCVPPAATSRSSRALRHPNHRLLPHIRTARFLHSFFIDCSITWNTLPSHLQIFDAPRSSFKRSLEAYWSNQTYSVTTS